MDGREIVQSVIDLFLFDQPTLHCIDTAGRMHELGKMTFLVFSWIFREHCKNRLVSVNKANLA
jgi:hypothetical protein